MRQKVALAIALLKDAPALLLDEPTGGLDPRSASDLVLLLRELRDQGKAILMATHDVLHAHQVADVIGFLKEGVLIRELRREEFVHEDLERLYLRLLSTP
jgi:ABC-2 type transport system ATP-binding protein